MSAGRIEWLETRIAPAAAVLDLSTLNGTNGFAVNGLAGDMLGASARGIGDINGDGLPDFVIGAPLADDSATPNAGRLAVVFGRTGGLPPMLSINQIDGTNGFVVVGEEFGDEAGFSVSAGDVNGDGLDDLIIGAPYGTGELSGIVYIVNGRTTFPQTLNLSPVAPGVTRIFGETPSGFAGFSVSTAGDFNNDEKDDILIGAPNASVSGQTSSGAAYLLFGATNLPSFLTLSDLTPGSGFKIQGGAQMDSLGNSVSSAGDLNNDGFDDVVIGAFQADSFGADSGSAYVIFGTSSIGGPVLVSALNGTNGFRIDGGAAGDQAGRSVSAAGDLNHDSIDDLVIGAPGADLNGQDSGAAYVIYGKSGVFPSVLNLSSVANVTGFKILGAAAGEAAGVSVAAAGDINRDRLGDLVIGAPGLSGTPGAAYILFGTTAGFTGVVSLANVDGNTGLKLKGVAGDDATGGTVAAAGDVNGDGFADIIIGAKGADRAGADSGTAYVVYGFANDATLPTISINNVSVDEGPGGTMVANFSVSLSGASSRPVTVEYATGNGTAVAPVDYTAVSLATLTFNPDEIVKTVTVTIANDNVVEPAEAFFVNLSNATNAIIDDAQGQGTILNDDEAVLSIANAMRLEGDTGAAPLSFVISLSHPSVFPISVLVSTVDGTATSGSDFTALSNQLVEFAPGELHKTITLDVTGDSIPEPNKTFGVQLINPVNASLGADTATGTIVDDDASPPNSNVLTFVEPDGDTVTVSVSGTKLNAEDITFAEDGSIAVIDLTRFAAVQQAIGGKPLNLSIGVKAAGGFGDGFTKVGLLNATGVGLGKVMLQGDLGQFLAGNGTGKSAVKSLSITGDLGSSSFSQLSKIVGGINKLSVGGFKNGAVQVDGEVGTVVIKGDYVGEPDLGVAALAGFAQEGLDSIVAQGGAMPRGVLLADSIKSMRIGGSMKGGGITTTKDLGDFSVLGDLSGGGLFSNGGMKAIKVVGKVISDDANFPATITARNRIDSLIVGGDMKNADILVGYNTNEEPVNPDASIGKVLVKGDWIASSLVAGIDDSTNDGFGRNDTVISGDTTPAISKIARVVIKGTASGSAATGDHFGITAQQIGKVSIGGELVPLTENADDVLVDTTNNDFRVVEIPAP